MFAYQLAVVVDDAAMGVTEVVRGADLLDSTPRQMYLYHLLGLTPPVFYHFPSAADGGGPAAFPSGTALWDWTACRTGCPRRKFWDGWRS